METDWTFNQRAAYKTRLEIMKTKDDNRVKFLDIVLQKCKMHNGPLTNVEELNSLVKGTSCEKTLKSMLPLEVQYRKSVQVKDVESRPELYKLNGLTFDQLAMNLTLLLTDSSDEISVNDVLFQTEDEILETSTLDQSVEEQVVTWKTHELFAVVWDGKKGKKWCIGFYLDHNSDGTFRVDHLKRLRLNSSVKWPINDDVQDVCEEQVLNCNIQGDWAIE